MLEIEQTFRTMTATSKLSRSSLRRKTTRVQSLPNGLDMKVKASSQLSVCLSQDLSLKWTTAKDTAQ